MSPRAVIVIDMQEKWPATPSSGGEKGGMRFAVLDRLRALGPDDRVVYVAMDRVRYRPEPLTVREAQSPAFLRQTLLACFSAPEDERPVYLKDAWDCTVNENLVRHLDDLYRLAGVRTFEVVGAYGECCIASSLNGLRRTFPQNDLVIEANDGCVKYLAERALGAPGRAVGRRILALRTFRSTARRVS